MKIQFIIIVIFASVLSLTDTSKDSRKHFGLSFHINCKDYVKTFKCMTACKSIGYQIFRMNNKCKCTCHEMKTSTILPFFKWNTNGTTRNLPKTRSPRLYHIVGTLSPAPESEMVDSTTIDTTLPNCVINTSTSTGEEETNVTSVGSGGNSTVEVTAGGAAGQNKSDVNNSTTSASPPPPPPTEAKS